jgi:hypothetical protein
LLQSAFIGERRFSFDISPLRDILVEGATGLLFFDYRDNLSSQDANKGLIRNQESSLDYVAAALSGRSNENSNNLGMANRQRIDSKKTM